MSVTPWTIAILSTGYDMTDVRAGLAKDLAGAGFDVIAYERPGYPVAPAVHSHKACLLAVDQADIAVLIIDKRYGELYLGIGTESITEKEYQAATKKKKIVIPCVRRQAWDERHQMYEEAKKLLKRRKRSNPRTELAPTYVDSWEVLDFIERVRKAARDNFVAIFENIVDLTDLITGRLAGLSLWLLKQLVRDQMRVVRDIKTTTGMAFSLGDVLEKGYFVEPPYIRKSGASNLGKTISRLGQAVRRQKACVAVLGEPGSGKSTLLGRAFLANAERSLRSNLLDLPFFVSLRGRGLYSFQFSDYVNECFRTLKQKGPYPLIKLDRIRPTFYLDGLDEMSEEQTDLSIARFCQSDMFSSPFMLSCRSRFAFEFLSDPTIGNRLSVVVELQPWNESLTTKYIEEFCRIQKCEGLTAELTRMFSREEEMREIGTNPLLLTLFLYVVSEAGLQVPIEIRSKRDLLSRTLEIWARREIVRLRGLTGETQHESDLLLQAWRVAAWLLYRARFTPAPPIKLEHLLANINTVVPEADGICESEAFGGLLDIRTHTNEVMGFLHEQLLEELVAELLCKGMQNSSCPFPGSLEVAVRWEINQLIRSMWAEAEPQALKDTLANIVRAFEASLADNAPASVLRRNQAAYYMGRLGIREGAGELRSADAKETNPFVKLSISFSLMKNLQFDVEDAFVRRLKDDPDWDAVNRGYHLFYYRDWHIPNPQPPYSDPGTIPWDNTARALLRHIESNSIDHVAIRRVELFTIRRFIETRRAKGPLTPAVIAKIEAAVNATTRAQYPDLPAGFHNQLLAEFTDLKTVWVSVQ